MVIDHVFGVHRIRRNEARTRRNDANEPHVLVRLLSAIPRRVAQFWCGMHGHFTMLHFEPNRLSLQCSLCGYATVGWDVGRPMTSRRHANNPQARPERRRTLRPLPTNARLAS
jgi:hypothetical protein